MRSHMNDIMCLFGNFKSSLSVGLAALHPYPVPLSILNLASINRIENKFGGKKKGERDYFVSPSPVALTKD